MLGWRVSHRRRIGFDIILCSGYRLWNTWGVACLWGRIGEQRPRGVRLHECADWDEALRLAAEVIELRLRHGYVVK